jgi:NAD(P)-dependent dehydrogenase (short-subunit alcohol dehydrogenase family)
VTEGHPAGAGGAGARGEGDELTGLVAVVTGGAQGIGLAIALHLASAGAAVAIADITPARHAAELVEQQGSRSLVIEVDVTSEVATQAMADTVMSVFGRLDVLVNNAALFTTLRPGPFSEISVDDWRRVMDVNVMGPFLCAKACAPAMRLQGGGRIINIASATPFKGTPFTLHYVTSKGAVVAFTRALARELGPLGILVNAVAPGLTLSDGLLQHSEVFESKIARSAEGRALERQQHPDDIVGAVRFLAGPGSAFITGQTLVVDGGSHLH